jgi:hypothetical protein
MNFGLPIKLIKIIINISTEKPRNKKLLKFCIHHCGLLTIIIDCNNISIPKLFPKTVIHPIRGPDSKKRYIMS